MRAKNIVLVGIILSLCINLSADMVWHYLPDEEVYPNTYVVVTIVIAVVCILLLMFGREDSAKNFLTKFWLKDETQSNQLPTTEDEITTSLDAGPDPLSDSTIPAPIEQNLFKAFHQLCTAAVDVPVAHLEGKAAEIRGVTEARNKILGENADQIAGQMKVSPEYVRRAGNKFAEKIIREQINLDKVSAIAANELKKEEFDSSTDQGADNGEEQTISDDWLNNFENEARQKSTQDMQLYFGRILAGEIKKPGSYSIQAVRTLGDLNQNDAILFKKLCSICVILEIPTVGHVLDVRVPSLGGNAGSNALRKYGLSFDHLNILNGFDLIIPDYNSWFDYQLCIANENPLAIIAFRLRHQGQAWVLLPSPEREKGKEFRLSGVALSRVGRELFSIVDPDPMENYTEDLKKFFARQNLQMVTVPT